MVSLLKRLRAALAIGSIWGVATGSVAMVFGALTRLPTGSVLSSALVFGATAGVSALVLGVGFGGMLSVMEARRSLNDLTSRRAALWGFVAGSTLAAVAGSVVWGTTGVFGVAAGQLGIPIAAQMVALVAGAFSYGGVTAGLATATVSLAKRATPSLPASGVESGALPAGNS